MPTSKKTIRIVAQQPTATLSKGQKTFNTLVEKIAQQRDTLTQWQAVALTYQQKVARDYHPMQRAFQDLQAAFARSLDQLLEKPGLTKTERQAVGDIIWQIAEGLITQTGDASLKPLYAKYRGADFDTQHSDAVESMKATMAEMFGFDIDQMADAQSPEEVLEHLRNQFDKDDFASPKAVPRKPTAKQLARAEAQKAEADKTSLSIREVYRKLASALHPDREPDLQERQRKTELMQRVNQAYAAKDLLKLLELQLELEHIDASTIAGLSDDRIRHYNKVLKEQLAELELEVDSLQRVLKAGFAMDDYQPLGIASVMPRLAQDIARMKDLVAQIKADARVLGDTKALKSWIKEYRREVKTMEAERRYRNLSF